MNLFEQAVNASNNADINKGNVINEIVTKCKDYVSSELFVDYIKRGLSGDAAKNREMSIYVSFWAYHSGCSTTHFRCGGWEWRNPDAPEYSFASHTYKGIHLYDIQIDVVREMCKLVKESLYEHGFSNISICPNSSNLGYADYKVVVKW